MKHFRIFIFIRAHTHLESFHCGFEIYALPVQDSPLLSRHPSKSSTHFLQIQNRAQLLTRSLHQNTEPTNSLHHESQPSRPNPQLQHPHINPHIDPLKNPPCASQQQNAPLSATAPQPGTSSALHISTTPAPKKIIFRARTLIFALWRRKRVPVGGILMSIVERRRLGLYVFLTSYFTLSPSLPSDASIWVLEFRVFSSSRGWFEERFIDGLIGISLRVGRNGKSRRIRDVSAR